LRVLLTRQAPLLVALTCLPAMALAQEEAGQTDQAPTDEALADEDASAESADEDDSEGGLAGTGSVELRIGFYNNSDSGDGNPFLDEAETVIEPVVVATYNVTDRLTLTGQLSYDLVSAASIERLSEGNRTAQQSGASADNYVGGDLGVSYQLTESARVGAHACGSSEYDYTSFAFGANVKWDLFEKNTTLTLGVNSFVDTVDIIRFDGSEAEGSDDRLSLTVNLGLYQVLTPTVHLSLGANLTHQSGFLETAFNGVVLEDPSDPPNPNFDNLARGVEVAEELPDTRLRIALFGEVRKIFPSTGTAVGLGGRFYTDSWGIVSGAVELKLFQWIVPDLLRVRVRYRYYLQTAADDYDDHFYVPPAQRANFIATQDRTQDSDLGDYDSHTLGLKVVVHLTDSITLDTALDYVLRSDGIDQLLVSGGVRWDF
jgi:Protein of unknown function (DUF3570)